MPNINVTKIAAIYLRLLNYKKDYYLIQLIY